MALFLMLLGVIFGAHLTAQQNGIIFLMVATDCLAAIASLMGALFVLYLCPLLSIPALLVYSILMYFGPDILIDVPGSSFHKIGCIFLPKLEESGDNGVSVDQYEHVSISNEHEDKTYYIHRGEWVEVPVNVFILLKAKYPDL